MVRRAEYAMGKAIRAGQERGEIRTRADNGGNLSTWKDHVTKYMAPGREHDDITALADADESTFDAALTEARAEPSGAPLCP